jgi:outer membrane murein-binding lipoprotein Lpp
MSVGTKISELPKPATLTIQPTDYLPVARGYSGNYSTIALPGASFKYVAQDSTNLDGFSLIGTTTSMYDSTSGTALLFKKLAAQAPVYINNLGDVLNVYLGTDSSLNSSTTLGVNLIPGGGLKVNSSGLGVSIDNETIVLINGVLQVSAGDVFTVNNLQPLLTATSPLTYSRVGNTLSFGLPYDNTTLIQTNSGLAVNPNTRTALATGTNGVSLNIDGSLNFYNAFPGTNLGLSQTPNAGFASILASSLSVVAPLQTTTTLTSVSVKLTKDSTLTLNSSGLGVSLNPSGAIISSVSGIGIQYDNTLFVGNDNTIGLNTSSNSSFLTLLGNSVSAISPIYITSNGQTLAWTLSTDLTLKTNGNTLGVNFDSNIPSPFTVSTNGLIFNYGDALSVNYNILNLKSSPSTTFLTLMSSTLSSNSFSFYANNSPVADNELANKAYVDAVATSTNTALGGYVLRSGSTLVGNISSSIPFGNSVELVNKGYVDNLVATSTKSVTLTSISNFIDTASINFTVNGNDVRADYIGPTNFLPLAGGTLTGPVAVGANQITTTPSYTPAIQTYSLVNKQYVDGQIQGLFTNPVSVTKDGPTTTIQLQSTSPLPTSPASYRVDLNGVVQAPLIDYTVDVVSSNSTYTATITFSTPVLSNERISVVANVAPEAGATYNPVLDPQSFLANPTNNTQSGTSFALPVNHVIANTGSGISTVLLDSTQLSPYQILGNVSGNVASVSLTGTNGITLVTSGNNLEVDGTIIENQIASANTNIKTLSGNVDSLSSQVTTLANAVDAASLASKISIVTTPTYTIGSTNDSNTTIGMNNTSSNIVYVPKSLDIPGYEVNIVQLGTGTTTIVPINGAIIRQPYGQFKLAQIYSAASLIYMNSTVGWILYGDLKS